MSQWKAKSVAHTKLWPYSQGQFENIYLLTERLHGWAITVKVPVVNLEHLGVFPGCAAPR